MENPQHRALAATRLLSKMPTIAAMSYKYTIEQPAAYPRNDLSYAGNFLQMLFAIPAEKYVLNPVIEQARPSPAIRLVHEQIARMCSGFRRDSHPMALMCALVGGAGGVLS